MSIRMVQVRDQEVHFYDRADLVAWTNFELDKWMLYDADDEYVGAFGDLDELVEWIEDDLDDMVFED
jgi:hypothetical protein